MEIQQRNSVKKNKLAIHCLAAGIIGVLALLGTAGCRGASSGPEEIVANTNKVTSDACWQAISDGTIALAKIQAEGAVAEIDRRKSDLTPYRAQLAEAVKVLRPADGNLIPLEFEQPAMSLEIALDALDQIIAAVKAGDDQKAELAWCLLDNATEDLQIILMDRINKQQKISVFRKEFNICLVEKEPLGFQKVVSHDPKSSLSPFWISKGDLTAAQYRSVMGALVRVGPLSVKDADEFCRKLTSLMGDKLPAGHAFRLPVVAEYETAGLPLPQPAQREYHLDQPGQSFRVVLAPVFAAGRQTTEGR